MGGGEGGEECLGLGLGFELDWYGMEWEGIGWDELGRGWWVVGPWGVGAGVDLDEDEGEGEGVGEGGGVGWRPTSGRGRRRGQERQVGRVGVGNFRLYLSEPLRTRGKKRTSMKKTLTAAEKGTWKLDKSSSQIPYTKVINMTTAIRIFKEFRN